MDITLQTNDENKILQLKNIRLLKAYGEADLYVSSNGFSVDTHFYFENHMEFVSELKKINKTLQGEAVLKQKYEKDYVKFLAAENGHIVVEGEIFWNGDFSQMIRFSFQTDQTVLGPLIADLEKAIDRNGTDSKRENPRF